MADERNERIKKALDKFTKKITVNASEARNALVQAGIYTCNGNLNTNYTLSKAEKR